MQRAALKRNSPWTTEDVDKTVDYYAQRARKDFWAFRQLVNPNMAIGWFQKQVAYKLQKFYEAYKRGDRPKLLLQSPPQHGKSKQIIDFVAWAAGQNPEDRTIYGSFSDRLGVRANLRLQRTYDSKLYQKIFPNTRINADNVVTIAGRRLRNREIIEYLGSEEGYFRNTTVLGSVTGEGLDFGIIDDPIKGRAEASSQTVRDKTWNWFTDDFMTRFSNKGALICIMTRWHLDDPGGRMIDTFPDLIQLRYPAIAEQDEYFRDKGEPLFPELKSAAFLEQQKISMTLSGWESVYQQNPIIVGGGLFPIDRFELVDPPRKEDVRKSVRYWDKAGTHGDGAYTAGVLMHHMKNGKFVIEHVVRQQLSTFEREDKILKTAKIDSTDGWRVQVWVEQEPGSGGKESAERTIINLAGFDVHKDPVRGNKELRAEPYAAQVQAGNIGLVKGGKWHRDFLDEHEAFPEGKYKDQVDAAGGAFAKLVDSRFDSEGLGLGLPIAYGPDDDFGYRWRAEHER